MTSIGFWMMLGGLPWPVHQCEQPAVTPCLRVKLRTAMEAVVLSIGTTAVGAEIEWESIFSDDVDMCVAMEGIV